MCYNFHVLSELLGHPAPPPQAQRSFLEALSGKSSEPFNPKTPRSFRGKPHVHFDAADIDRYSKPFNHALIGKFSNGRPSMDRIRKSFIAIGFSGQYSIGLIDYRHLIIRFNHEDDYIRCFLKRKWSIDGFVMRVLKWHYKFSVDTESSIVPVWVKFPLLPLHLYNKEALYSIARLIGAPLKLDASTSSFNRPSVARVCVEIDLLKELITEVWITQMDFGFWQTVEYDDLPSFCSSCSKVGHSSDVCRRNSATSIAAQPKKIEAQMSAAPSHQKWQIKSSVAPAAALSVTADDNPITQGQDALLPSSVLPGNLGTNAASASQAPLPTPPAPVPAPIDLHKQSTHSLAAAHVAASSVPSISEFSPSPVLMVSPAAAPVVDAAAAARSDLTATSSIQPVIADANLSQPAAATTPHSAAAPAPKIVFLQHPLLSVQTTVAAVADAAEGYIFVEPVLNSAAQPPFSAVDNLPCPTRRNGVLDVASARKEKEYDVSEKTYVDVLLGAKLAAEKSYVDLNPNAPLFVPKTRFPGTSSSVSIKPRFHTIKSAEYPSLPLPNFRIFFSARPQFPQDSLEEPSSPRPSDIFQMFSEGDDVPRLPIQRKKLSVSLRASCQDFNAILKKGRRPEPLSFNRKKWKKLAPYSLTDQTSTSNNSPNNAPDFQERPTANANEEVPGDDSSVAYETNWHSSTSEDDTTNDFDYPLASIAPLMALEYEDFSLSPPRRRKYNKRFRDLPPPLPTRRSQPTD